MDKEPVLGKTTPAYWNESWARASGKTFGGYFWRRLDREFVRILSSLETHALTLLEVGAGGSEYLPYFFRRFGFRVVGIDYSEIGCARARQSLQGLGAPGEIRLVDMFQPPADMLYSSDVVFSAGLVEHFVDTSRAIAACAAFGRPGGLVITLIPNMKGLYGKLFKLYDRRAYETHVPLDLHALMAAHVNCGLRDVRGEYLLGLPGFIDRERHEPSAVKRMLRRAGYRLSSAYWYLEEKGLGVPENAFTSPYMVCIARLPEVN